MQMSKRTLAMMVAAAFGVLSLLLAGGAFAAAGKHPGRAGTRHRGRGVTVFDASLAPSQPTDPVLHGVKPGGAPWVLTSGRVRLTSGGTLNLVERGLVIPTTGTAAPVTTISASLYCGADATSTPAATTPGVPISSAGAARIHDRSFAVPSTCLAPVILVHPNGNAGVYIALDGWRMS
jgi:hypothetical protein